MLNVFHIYPTATLIDNGFIGAEPALDRIFRFGVVTFIEGKRVYLGSHRTIEAAAEAEAGFVGRVMTDEEGREYTELVTERNYIFAETRREATRRRLGI